MNFAYELFISKKSSFEELLEKDDSVSIHHKNLRSLDIEIYKIKNGLSPILIQELFMPNNGYPYNLRHLCQFTTSSVNAVHHIQRFFFFRT